MNGRKGTSRAKLKAVRKKDFTSRKNVSRIWSENVPKSLKKLSKKIINGQVDVKLELNAVWKKVKNRKAAGLNEIVSKFWKTREFDDILLRLCNAVYRQNTIEKWTKGYILHFLKKWDLEITKNYRGITLTAIAPKVYYSQSYQTKYRENS